LVIYVDDFNLSAPVKAHDRLWADLMKRLNLEKPSAPDRFLGCYTRAFNCKAKDLEMILKNKPELYQRGKSKAEEGDPLPLSSLKEYRADTPVRGYMHNMEEYLTKNVERYLKDTGTKGALKRVDTPFVDEAREPMGCTVLDDEAEPPHRKTVRVLVRVMRRKPR
jgi:hypothetical protein